MAPTLGTVRFEVGDPDLGIERALGLDVSVRRRSARAAVEVNAFVYRITNFVFLNVTGAEVRSVPGDARFAGWEAGGYADLRKGLRVRGGVGGVTARLTETNESLPRIPPLAASGELELTWGRLTLNPEVVVTARQDQCFAKRTQPVGGRRWLLVQAMWSCSAGQPTHSRCGRSISPTAKSHLHTSFIKDLAPEMGRGVRLTYTVNVF